MKNTKIEWAHHTVNFVWGCMKVSAACLHCYAELLAKLFSRGKATWGATGARWIRHEAARRELYALDKALIGTGRRERVFINSMSDTFEDRDDLNEARARLWDACHNVGNLDMLLLTKRPENILQMVPRTWLAEWPAHVWIGTTIETQAMADLRVPLLLQVPARVRFLSCEPLLGPVSLAYTCFNGSDSFGMLPGIHWVICGGESGAQSRPMHPDWARVLRDQCAAGSVPFHFKQWGEWLPQYQRMEGEREVNELRAYHWPDGAAAHRIGKKAAGRLLDGREHNEFPTP